MQQWLESEVANITQRLTRRFSILLVEDNTVNQRVATALLEKEGHLVTIAENGQIALDNLLENSFDLVLMDCQMPVLDGYQAATRWRDIEDNQNRSRVPIIALTANVMPEDKERCLTAGMDDFLPKPVKPHDLRETIARWKRRTS